MRLAGLKLICSCERHSVTVENLSYGLYVSWRIRVVLPACGRPITDTRTVVCLGYYSEF